MHGALYTGSARVCRSPAMNKGVVNDHCWPQKGWQQRGRQIAPAHLAGASQAVRAFIKQYADGAFDPEVMGMLEDAFDDAWRRVQTSKAPYSADEYAVAGRTILARHIIQAAKAGERDPRWLADSALPYLSRLKLSQTPPDEIL